MPSTDTLRNWEFDLAGGCLASVIDRIAKDALLVKQQTGMPLQISLITDHGNREGVDHLVKMICWSSVDRDGNRMLRHFNLDVDRGGHTYIEAANAISHSLRQLLLDDYDVEFSFITGDSGGGAKVQKLHPTLRDSDAMTEWSEHINCILHAFNLAFQTGCMDSLGDQGMNKLTVFQMLYLAILLMNTIKKQTDLETLKKCYSLTMTQLLEREDYKIDASDTFVKAFEALMKEVEDTASDETLMEDIGIQQLLNGCPTNIKEPNFGRWGTITAVARVVKKHWLPLFYIAKNVKATEKAGCYLHTIATNLINLMNSRSDPKQKTPTHYASLLWIVGFADYMLDDHMEWVKMNDSTFGPGSYGNITRLVPAHLYLYKEQLMY
eukprot:scaffold28426_cov37-Cyclotella_meneghiniana.AAC.2